MSLWESQSIQFVWFLSSNDEIKTNDVFESLMGEEPVSFQRNKAPNPANPFLAIANGPIDGSEATLQLQPGRMDLVITPSASVLDSAEVGVATIPTISTCKRVLAGLPQMALKVPCVRLALVLNLLKPAENVDEARLVIEQMISQKPKFDDYSDLMFQINRRKSYPELDKLAVNRLLRFHVTAFQSVMMTNHHGAHSTSFSRENFAASMMVDVNTVPDGRLFASDDFVTIFSTLAEEALRIGAVGAVSALED